MTLMVLKSLFIKLHFDVETAQNGQIAYEKVEACNSPNSKPFDLVVLDLEMPVCNGYTAC